MSADPVKEFEAYRTELLDLLGDQDPLLVLEDTPAELAARLSKLDEDTMKRRPAPDAWSVAEIVGHLGDTEWVYGTRQRLVLTHDRPELVAYDQDLMVAGLEHADRSVDELVREFTDLRTWNLALYQRTRGEAWARTGLHAERGEESVELNIELLAGHDLRHLRQIERTVEGVGG